LLFGLLPLPFGPFAAEFGQLAPLFGALYLFQQKALLIIGLPHLRLRLPGADFAQKTLGLLDRNVQPFGYIGNRRQIDQAVLREAPLLPKADHGPRFFR
jgi:hypothetical protein